MTQRSVVILLLVLAGTVVVMLLRFQSATQSSTEPSPDRSPGRAAHPDSGTRGLAAVDEAGTPSARRTGAAAEVEESKTSTTPIETANTDEFASLLDRLREVDRTTSDSDFYPAATKIAEEIGSWVDRSSGDSPGRLENAASDTRNSARVRSALAFAAGRAPSPALESWLNERAADPSEDLLVRRGAVLGLARSPKNSEEAIYTIQDFWRARTGRVDTFRLTVARGAHSPATLDTLLRIATSIDDLTLRAICILVVGGGVDHDERIPPMCFSFMDAELKTRSDLLLAAIFVLAHAREKGVIQSLVLRADEADGTPMGEVRRMDILGTLAQHGLSVDTLPVIMRASTDQTLSNASRTILLIYLSDVLTAPAFDSGTGRASVFEHLHVAALTDPHPLTRMAAFTSMAGYPSADTLATLESMLLHDADAEVRADVVGMAFEISVDHGATSRILVRAFDVETVLEVREQILAALVQLRHPGSEALFERIVRQDPDGELGRLARAGLAALREN